MKPVLFPADAESYSSNGLGVLSDALSCEVTEELDGVYELVMQYPISGLHYALITLRSLIVAKPNRSDVPQPFRIYRISKPINGIVTVYAEHISYDLAGIPVDTFTAANAAEAMAAIKAHSAAENPFRLYTDKTTIAQMRVTEPRSARSCIFGESGSLLDVYSGDMYFDRYTVSLLARRGADNGVKIVYGKNMTDLNQEENIANAYTGIYPYAVDMDENLVILPEKIIHATGDFDFERIKTVDLSAEFATDDGEVREITVADLRTAANRYMRRHSFGKPKVSISVSFASLAETEEYKNIAFLETVDLGDTVTVEFPALGVSSSARCAKTTYNVLTEKYKSIIIGDVNRTIADSMADVPSKEFVRDQDSSTRAALNASIKKATEVLNGANGGVFEILDENEDGINDAWVLHTYDNQKYLKATADGIGLTTDGGKSYSYAMTADGINGEYITAGKIAAERIDADNLHVRAANITGTLTIGQLPSDVATTDDLMTRTDVVSIINGTVTAAYVNALNITARSLLITDTDGTTLFSANDTAHSVQIAGFFASDSQLYGKTQSGTPELYTDYETWLRHGNLSTATALYYQGVLSSSYKWDFYPEGINVTATKPNLTGKINLISGSVDGYDFTLQLNAATKTLTVL